MLRIAHLSDPHVNLKYHPSHLPRLRKVLSHALEESQADHIIITGDLSSNADHRDLDAARKLFVELGILNAERLTLVIGNHDIYGGPHLAEDLLSFPGRCTSRDFDQHVQFFYECFQPTFAGTYGPFNTPFPFVKIVKDVALIGINSIARPGTLKNPVGSNGEISSQEMEQLRSLLESSEVHDARHRILLLHHHLYRRKDEEDIHTLPETNRIVQRIEHQTLKLRGKRKLFKLLKEHHVNVALHGHIHFTGEYERKGILCLNGGGAVYPVNHTEELKYNLLMLEGKEFTNRVVSVGSVRKQSAKNGQVTSNGQKGKVRKKNNEEPEVEEILV